MATKKTAEKALANGLWVAKSLADIEALITDATKLYGPLRWHPVGDRENNIGTIRIASDPALAFVERVTNGMDDILELGRLLHPRGTPASPREAAQMWFGVPKRGLSELSDKERRSLGERLQVVLEESGESKRPTIVVDDRGAGQCPSDFPKTLLSLNESNKVGQPYTMGTYGQGGSVTYGFSRATVILSRRDPRFNTGQPDRVGWTIVQEQETDPALQRMPSYRYLVGDDDQVFTLEPSLLPDLPSGTRITHIAYDLQGWTGPFTTGIWQFFHAALFDPVLPFLITGNRSKEKSYGSRIVIGNTARLQRPDKAKGDVELAHSDSAKLDLTERFGAVNINYWVVRRPHGSTKDSDPAAGYVQAGAAVSMTLFGQRQDVEPRTWIKDHAKLPFLYKNLIVQIDADELTPVAKRELFASTRERATHSELRQTIYRRLAAVLLADDELKRLNHEEKERLLQKSTRAASEKVRKRLGQFIKTKLKDQMKPGKASNAKGTGGIKKKPPTTTPSHQRDTSDTHLHNVPTKLHIRNKMVRVYQGAGGYTWVEIDAKNGYLPEHDDDLTVTWDGADPAGKVRLSARSKLLGGLTRWFFEADSDASIGEYSLTATLVTANGVLSDSMAVTVVAPPPAKQEQKGTEPDTGPEVRWVDRDDWEAHDGMDAHKVGYVTEDDEQTIIWVNRHFQALDKALSGPTLTAEVIGVRSERYQYPVACGLWLQHHAQKSAETKPDERYLTQEAQRLAEAVLVAIDPDADLAAESGEPSA